MTGLVGGRRRVLVVAAHPDDEVLGCGGTIARHVVDGDEARVLLLGEGIVSRLPAGQAADAAADVERLRKCGIAALATLGVEEPMFERFPDNAFDSVPLLELVRAVERVVTRCQPEIVYTHHGGDLNVDHRLTLQAVLAACRPQPGHSVREIYAFEVPSATGWNEPAHLFSPTLFVNIATTLPRKLAAAACYGDEMRPWPHARSLPALEHLARWRGASVGCEAAEAFHLVRALV